MTDTLTLPATTLAAYLEAHVPGFRGPLRATKFKSGQSNPTYLVDADSGRYVLPVKKAVRLAEQLEEDDPVTVRLELLE